MPSELKKILISSYKQDMITYMENHPEVFDEAVKLALSDDQPFSWRAAWILSGVMKKNDKRIQRYIKEILSVLKYKKDGHQLCLLKILFMIDLSDRYEGLLFNYCIDLWEDISKIPSVRITALRLAVKIAEKYPELSNEISFLAQDHYLETLSPGIRRCVQKIFNQRKKVHTV